MMSHDPEGKMGPKMQLPDNVIVHEPKAVHIECNMGIYQLERVFGIFL